jgi:antirestriction protein
MTRSWSDLRGDTFDSRDIIARLDDLRADPDALDDDEREELVILEDIESSAEGYGDWLYGETFIPDADFEDYARDLADDIGAVPSDAQWPLTYIDWPAAADALRQDYTSYTFDGIDYLARS